MSRDEQYLVEDMYAESNPPTPGLMDETATEAVSSKRPRASESDEHPDDGKRLFRGAEDDEEDVSSNVSSVANAASAAEPAKVTPPTFLVVTDPHSKCGEFNSFSAFCLLLAKLLEPGTLASLDRAPGGGYKLKTRAPGVVAAKLQSVGLVASIVDRKVDIVVRGVPTAASVEEIQNDLQSRLGLDELPAVRRLHAHSDGVLDRGRPIPVVVVTVPESSRKALSSWQFLGLLQVRCSSTEKERPSQCFRCFQWGHRAAACRGQRRCIRCGHPGHTAETCAEPRADPRCVACGGDHMVTWGGCPRKAAFVRQQHQQQQQKKNLQRQQQQQHLEPAWTTVQHRRPRDLPLDQPRQPVPAQIVVDSSHEEQWPPLPQRIQPPREDVTEASRSLAQRILATRRALDQQLETRDHLRTEAYHVQTMKARRRAQRAATAVNRTERKLRQLQQQRREMEAAKRRGGVRFVPPPSSQLPPPLPSPETRQQQPQPSPSAVSPAPAMETQYEVPPPPMPEPDLWRELLRTLADIQTVLARVDATVSHLSRWLPQA